MRPALMLYGELNCIVRMCFVQICNRSVKRLDLQPWRSTHIERGKAIIFAGKKKQSYVEVCLKGCVFIALCMFLDRVLPEAVPSQVTAIPVGSSGSGKLFLELCSWEPDSGPVLIPLLCSSTRRLGSGYLEGTVEVEAVRCRLELKGCSCFLTRCCLEPESFLGWRRAESAVWRSFLEDEVKFSRNLALLPLLGRNKDDIWAFKSWRAPHLQVMESVWSWQSALSCLQSHGKTNQVMILTYRRLRWMHRSRPTAVISNSPLLIDWGKWKCVIQQQR